MSKRMCVIGSGPAAVATAHTLAKAGADITILDVGFTLEPESQALLERYHEDTDAERMLREIHRLRKQHHRHSEIQPGKSLFGSDYSFRTVDDTDVVAREAVIRSSLGQGGLSAVWGATVSTAVPRDLADWPIDFAELTPHYRALDEIMSVSSPPGELGELLPLEIGAAPTFELGVQGRDLLERLRQHRSTLASDGMYVGRAKVAVGRLHSLDGEGCTPCGLCMHGCPNRAIFNAAFVLEELSRRANVTYRPQTLVERFSESGDEVRVCVKNLTDGSRSSHVFDRLFVGCGIVNSTAIVARSLALTDHEFTIKDSQKYIFPLLRWKRSKGATRQPDNTLAQVYLLVDNPEVSHNVVQVQYYGYNDLLLEPIRQRLGYAITATIPRLMASLVERMMIVFVYIHSNESGHLKLRINESLERGGKMGTVRGVPNPRSKEVIRSLLGFLMRHRTAHGGWPIAAALQTTLPGDSQHIGSTLPMSRNPDKYQTDTLGRPYSCQRVHVVDPSVFPSVPATPIVYTLMANAARIADTALRELN